MGYLSNLLIDIGTLMHDSELIVILDSLHRHPDA